MRIRALELHYKTLSRHPRKGPDCMGSTGLGSTFCGFKAGGHSETKGSNTSNKEFFSAVQSGLISVRKFLHLPQLIYLFLPNPRHSAARGLPHLPPGPCCAVCESAGAAVAASRSQKTPQRGNPKRHGRGNASIKTCKGLLTGDCLETGVNKEPHLLGVAC